MELLNAEDNLDSVRQVLQAANGKYPTDQWIANLTGGTKPMSIAAYEFFKERGGNLVYTNVARPSQFIDVIENRTEDGTHRLRIKEFLAGYGFESRKADDKLDEAETRARGWVRSAILLARHASEKDVLALNDDEEQKRALDKGIELPAGRFTFPCDETRQVWLGTAATRKLNKYEAKFLTSGWLEVFVWDLLTRHADALNVWDVRLGMEIGRCGDTSGNEFDVAFMHNHGLSMVECKSGSQGHDRDNNALYKVEAVTRQFRALRVRSCLTTTGTNILDRQGRVKETIRTRAEIYGCRVLTAEQIRQLASDAVTAEIVREVFFGKVRR